LILFIKFSLKKIKIICLAIDFSFYLCYNPKAYDFDGKNANKIDCPDFVIDSVCRHGNIYKHFGG
jgi:hypothetical protein